MPDMGTSNRCRGPRQALGRLAFILCGALSVLWTSEAFPSFRLTMPARELTARIIGDERFRPDALADMQARMSAGSQPMMHPEIVLARAFLQLRVAEQTSLRKSSEDVDRETEAAEAAVKASLLLSPTDSFLWMTIYSIEITHNGFTSDSINYLNQSYLGAPFDGWIALRRIRLALAVFPLLNGPLQERVVAEFSSMVDSGYFDEAAFILTNFGWTQRDRLLQSLRPLDALPREAFAKRLIDNGVKLHVPGVELVDRPWR